MISLGLGGQLLFSIIAGHSGWFNPPVQPMDGKRTIGLAAIILGILLVNRS